MFCRLQSAWSVCLLSVGVTGFGCPAIAHDGPDPVAHYIFSTRTVQETRLKSRLGPDGILSGTIQIATDEFGSFADFSGDNSQITLATDWVTEKKRMPEQDFTVCAWVAVNERQEWGGIIGTLQDNGGAETGWLLGYDDQKFFLALSTEGADDGDGSMTYLRGKTDYELGKFYHVTGVYNGEQMELYVNGKLEAASNDQSGPILYPKSAPWVIGAYRDADEFFSLRGRLRDVALYDMAAKGAWVKKEFDQHHAFASLPPAGVDPEKLELLVGPYLQFATKNSITVMWQTTMPATSVVHHGETAETKLHTSGSGPSLIHEVTLQKLQPETQYFYRIESAVTSGESIGSDVFTFQTASHDDSPFAFAIISDTQGNPAVASTFAKMAWEQRPNFLIHPGDLVSTGSNDRHWLDHFFPSMQNLIGRVPMYPVLGNHELNARNYYDYMSLPKPEYFYDFVYGNAHFFMIDSNKEVGPGSEQYAWLGQQLAKSEATWKFVVHHHPPYSSDENDYGNLWQTNRSTFGDQRVRQICSLYDKHDVDVVFNGHIHSYERTWPVEGGDVVPGRGTVYMITGGGGGSLERPGPFRPAFQNNVRRGHHYCMVHINGAHLEFKAFDLDGRLFDYFKITK